MQEELVSAELRQLSHLYIVECVHLFGGDLKSICDGSLLSTRLLWKEDQDKI